MSKEETIFSKILEKKIPSSIVYEDEFCAAFKDLNPQAPVHVLLVPRKALPRLNDSDESDVQLLGHLLVTAPRIAEKLGIGSDFRIVINNGEKAGQTVFHLHLHILGGRQMEWPPG